MSFDWFLMRMFRTAGSFFGLATNTAADTDDKRMQRAVHADTRRGTLEHMERLVGDVARPVTQQIHHELEIISAANIPTRRNDNNHRNTHSLTHLLARLLTAA